MKIELLNEEQFNILTNIYNENKGLFLQNEGYQYINESKLSDEDKEAFKTVTNILKDHIIGFTEFNNFRLNRDNKIQLRFQYNWSYDTNRTYFIGVGYILLDELLNGFEEKDK